MHFGNDITRDYVEALEARGIPHLLVGGKTFHEREEVDAIRTALTAIEWPEDELSVYATLHGPLFAIGEEELLEYHSLARAFHPYRVPKELARSAAAGREGADDAARAARRAQSSAGRRHDRPADRDHARACRIHPVARRRAGAGQRAAHFRPRAALRAGGRPVVPRLRRHAARRLEPRRISRGADPRRRQRRRAADDRAQGEGPRVPGRRARRHRLQAEPGRCVALSRSREASCARSASAAGRRSICRSTTTKKPGATKRKAFGSLTSPPPARATCSSCPRLATARTTRAGSARSIARSIRRATSGSRRRLREACRSSRASRRSCPTRAPTGSRSTTPFAPARTSSPIRIRPEPTRSCGGIRCCSQAAADDARGVRREDLISKDANPADVAADRAAYDHWRERRSAVQASGSVASMRVATATRACRRVRRQGRSDHDRRRRLRRDPPVRKTIRHAGPRRPGDAAAACIERRSPRARRAAREAVRRAGR